MRNQSDSKLKKYSIKLKEFAQIVFCICKTGFIGLSLRTRGKYQAFAPTTNY